MHSQATRQTLPLSESYSDEKHSHRDCHGQSVSFQVSEKYIWANQAISTNRKWVQWHLQEKDLLPWKDSSNHEYINQYQQYHMNLQYFDNA